MLSVLRNGCLIVSSRSVRLMRLIAGRFVFQYFFALIPCLKARIAKSQAAL